MMKTVETTNGTILTSEQAKNSDEAIARIKAEWLKADKSDVSARYGIAKIAVELKDTSKYGDRAHARVDESLGRGNSTLYAYAKVAETWNAEEFAVVSGKLNDKGMALSWSHWELLATVGDGRARRPLLEQTLRECLTVRELRAAIKEGDSSGDPAEAGSDPVQSLESKAQSKLTRLLSSMEREARAVEDALLPMISAANSKLTDLELSEFRATLKSIEAAENTLDRLKNQLRKATGEAADAHAPPPIPAIKASVRKRAGKTHAPDQHAMRA